jgi:hypothetical protein
MCNSCGRPEYQHGWFSKDEMEEMWRRGLVLTICDGSDPEGSICLVTHNTVSEPENPHTVESLMEISS